MSSNIITTHSLGFARIGVKRELKKALEAYWNGHSSAETLQQTAEQLRARHWQLQQQNGIDLLPVGDFALYDHVLNTSLLFGVVAKRHGGAAAAHAFDTQFVIGRGRSADKCCTAAASDMTKWFNTNYHYIVPELTEHQSFELNAGPLLAQIAEAGAQGLKFKPVLIGPITYLHLAKATKESDKLDLLPALLARYQQLLQLLAAQQIEWLQLDEPVLAMDLPPEWQQAFVDAYQQLNFGTLKVLLTTYFGDVSDKLAWLRDLPVAGIHLDVAAQTQSLPAIVRQLPPHWVFSAGIIDGRNIWRADLSKLHAQLAPVYELLQQRLWLAPSCSLLHCPIDVEPEKKLPATQRQSLAFAKQKCQELDLLRHALQTGCTSAIDLYSEPVLARQHDPLVFQSAVRQRTEQAKTQSSLRPVPFARRQILQQQRFELPLLPTTTIGSFPQTQEIRQLRVELKAGRLHPAKYQQAIRSHIAHAIAFQHRIGLDVLVHGEAERNDMVEYFAEYLQGYLFTQQGWVQSYGSRCVKPPVIYGDIVRTSDITVAWSQYAQSLSDKPVKGMLTGPVTMLNWSFVRDDLARSEVALQLSLALADEVAALEQAGIAMIQIDEPALREGLPLKQSAQAAYLDWAVDAFRRCSTAVAPTTQIHTHMCYAEFNDIMPAIAALDADVISIETSRSDMALLKAFEDFSYPAEIGPGVYDIHSPNIPDVSWMKSLIRKANAAIPLKNLWVNPDCGLKTRDWPETEAALSQMVQACRELRTELA